MSDIGKLVVVSSTGFLGPGLDCHIIQEIGLSRGVDRTLIGFMGCAAAMNGFRVGMDYVRCHEKVTVT
jgi:alpha-pyrone synthase